MSLLLDYLPLFAEDQDVGYVDGYIRIRAKALVRVNLQQIEPTIVVSRPKAADINTYILHHHHEVEVSSGVSAHIEIESRRPEIKVIDID